MAEIRIAQILIQLYLSDDLMRSCTALFILGGTEGTKKERRN